MSYKLINANNITFNSDGFITAKNIEKMPCIYADLPNGMDGEHYVLEQEPKTGHWIAQDIHNCHTEFKCSECGYVHDFMHLYGEPTADYTYCPKCGCRMESD